MSFLIRKFHDIFFNKNEKNSIVFQNLIGSFAVRGLALVISVFSMPAYIRFFNNETTLGLWFTVLSVLNWILNFDLGIGNGLRNHLTVSLTEGANGEAKGYISSAYFSIGIVVIMATLLFFFIFDYVNWNRVFNIQENIISNHTLLNVVRIVFLGIMGQFFLKLINSVLYAMQKSFLNSFLTLCTSLITVLFLVSLPSGSNEQNMITMAVLHALAVLIPLFVATIIVFSTRRMRELKPSFKFVSKTAAKRVLSLGGVFFFVQIAYMVIVNTDNYLITIFDSANAVVEYQIYHRLFTLVGTVFSLALTPVWSAITKALAENDYHWVKKLYKRLLIFAVSGTVLEFFLIPFLQIIVNLWLGKESITVNIYVALPFAAVGSLMIWNSMLSSFACGTGKLKTQSIFYGIGAVAKVPLAYLFVTTLGSWIGVLYADVVVLGLYCFAESIMVRRALDV